MAEATGIVKLDINTPKGREATAQETTLIKALHKHCKDAGIDIQFAETDKSQPANLDGVMVVDGKLVGIYEVKCRDISLDTLVNKYSNEAMITNHKLELAINVSKIMRVPFFFIIYLLHDGVGLYVQVTDERGKVIVEVRTEVTGTPRSINGGWVERDNAFIDMSKAYKFEVNKK